jgi:hypothetical protein
MTLNRKDLAATLLTALAVAVFAATHEGWQVWLVGDSHRWAAAVIAVLGIAACALGTPGSDTAAKLMSVAGVIAGALAVVAIASGSLTPLSLLVAAIVLLWAVTTWRHAHRAPRRALPT